MHLSAPSVQDLSSQIYIINLTPMAIKQYIEIRSLPVDSAGKKQFYQLQGILYRKKSELTCHFYAA